MSNKDLEQFAYMAAHDLREPLIAVSAYLRILEQRYTNQLDPDVHKFLSRAIDTTCRMDTLIQNILAYSRLGSDTSAFETTDSATCLRQALSNLQAAIEESGAQVRSDPLPSMMGNPAQLVQLFQNLVSNAIKFRGDRPVEIHVGVERLTGEYRFWVRDNGIGIESPHIEGIFRLFQRVENGAGRSGSGIGLANCKKIVEHHGGRIWVESEPGRGSTFFFTIPRDQDSVP
jgi:light-regulated signal transduction histidine kinase (bacteriophytochrome)